MAEKRKLLNEIDKCYKKVFYIFKIYFKYISNFFQNFSSIEISEKVEPQKLYNL